ncbi:MAG: hypothetical protein IPI80_00195 [Burkholderiales bacterium]|nr:hypothetical protein [Burkholderiales bacterium]
MLLMDRFQRAIQHAKRSRTQFAVLMVDLKSSRRSTTPMAMPPATRCWSPLPSGWCHWCVRPIR